jgi:hypothetical protein
MNSSRLEYNVHDRTMNELEGRCPMPFGYGIRRWAVAALRQPRPRPADGPGSVTLVSREGALRGFVAPLRSFAGAVRLEGISVLDQTVD